MLEAAYFYRGVLINFNSNNRSRSMSLALAPRLMITARGGFSCAEKRSRDEL